MIRKLLIFLITVLPLCACSDDFKNLGTETSVDAVLTVTMPEEVNPEAVSDARFSLYNIATGATTLLNGTECRTSLMPGLYDIEFSATEQLPNGPKATIRAYLGSVTITAEGTNSVTLSAFRNIATDDLIIAEIFFTGTMRPSGNAYTGDTYIKLYNNTDHVIYADGLTLFESKFLTTQNVNPQPNVMAEAVSVDALYTIPGNGTDVAVQPGEFLLLADVAIDHRVLNPNSLDLSHADFEWYDESSTPSTTDIDNPDVPNLDKWYCYTQSVWLLHNRGFKAYGLARIQKEREDFLRDNYYEYDYTMVTSAGSFPMTQTAYRLPNAWVVDVVNLSVQSDFQWLVTAPELDMGWAYCGTINNDKTRYFTSVRRRVAGFDAAGRMILEDTNNSSADFNSQVVPSEIELQGTAMDVNGTPASAITLDGVTPMQ